MKKRKTYSPLYRAKIALAAMRGNKTINQLAEEFNVSTQFIIKLKTQLKEGLKEKIVEIFQTTSPSKKSTMYPDEKKHAKKLLQLETEFEWLKGRIPPITEIQCQMVDPDNPNITVVRQCELLGLSRSTYYFYASKQKR